MLDTKKLAANLSFLVIGETISKIFTFVGFALLARSFGPIEFGHLEFALAVIMIGTLLTDFGANPLGSREVAKNQEKEKLGEIVVNIIGMRVILFILTYTLLTVFALFFLKNKPQLKSLVLLYGLSLFFIPLFLQFVFQGLEKMQWVAVSSVIRQMVFVIGVFLVIFLLHQIWIVAIVEIAAVGSLALYCVLMLLFHVKASNYTVSFPKIAATFKEALPIGLSDLTWALMWYSATILLGLMTTGKAVGWFSAAHRPVMTLHTFVWLYFCNLLPSISRSADQPKEVLDNLMHHSMNIMAWGTVLLGTIGLTMAEPLMTLVFGNQFRESAEVMKVLIWMIPLSSLGCHYRYILIGYGFQKYEFIAHAAAAVCSVVMGYFLIPVFSQVGASYCLITALSLYCLLVFLFVKFHIRHIPFLPRIIMPVIGGIVMIIIFFIINNYLHWGVAAGISVPCYIFIMILFQPELKKFNALFSLKRHSM